MGTRLLLDTGPETSPTSGEKQSVRRSRTISRHTYSDNLQVEPSMLFSALDSRSMMSQTQHTDKQAVIEVSISDQSYS